MWGGLAGIGLAVLMIGACFFWPIEGPDLRPLMIVLFAYLMCVASWIAISVGVTSRLIACPNPPMSKVGFFQFVCVGCVAAQFAVQAYFSR